MKKVGFLMVYNEFDWVGYQIDQAAKLCDKLIICEGSQFANYPHISERSTDGTLDIISDKIKEYPDFIEVFNTVRDHTNYRHNQCADWNIALSKLDIGDYFLPLDADEIYLDSFIEEINDLIDEGKIEFFTVHGQLFGFSFKWQLNFSDNVPKKDVFYKKIKGFHFVPTHQPRADWKYTFVDERVKFFHYTWVKPSDRMRVRMETSNFVPGMLSWFDNSWDKIKLVSNESQRSHLGSTFTLQRYNGDHSSILSNHPWLNIEDIRRIK